MISFIKKFKNKEKLSVRAKINTVITDCIESVKQVTEKRNKEICEVEIES